MFVGLGLNTTQPGLVIGMYFYGCDPAACATRHDEIDIELVTKVLQPGALPQLQVNRYAGEPLGAGNGSVLDLPAGFDTLAQHDYRMLWQWDRIVFSVDGRVLMTATDHIPHGPMQTNLIAWAPGPEWALAYSGQLKPVDDPLLNTRYVALVNSVAVTAIPVIAAVPEPQTWALLLCGLGMVHTLVRRRKGLA